MNSAWTSSAKGVGGIGSVRIKLNRIPQKIPLNWADDPSSKRLLKHNEWLVGPKSRLPRHYVEFYKKWEIGPQAFIHDEKPKARFEKDEFGNVRQVQIPRIPVIYPKEFHQGLWGGEGVIKGQSEMYEVKKRNKHEARYIPGDPTYWYPKLHYGVVHSEILNKHIQVIMTERAQRLIDDVYGLDNYLLKTEVNEIYSHLGLKMKREILLTLANPEEELYPMDSAKRTDLLDQYKDYILPHEEADWHGLSLSEALHKQHTLDRIEEEESIVPAKEKFRYELLEQIQSGDFEESDVGDILKYELEPQKPSMFDSFKTKISKKLKGK